MKIKPTFNKENISDVLEINGNDLIVNGNEHDIETTEEIILSVAMNRNFLFINNNYLTFHDKDINGDFDFAELTDFVRCYNMENDDRIEEHRQVYVEYCLQSVGENNKDKSRAFYNLRTPGTLRANYTKTLKQFIIDEKIEDSNFKAEVMAGYEAWLEKVRIAMEVR